jgi:hypothetical protein
VAPIGLTGRAAVAGSIGLTGRIDRTDPTGRTDPTDQTDPVARAGPPAVPTGPAEIRDLSGKHRPAGPGSPPKDRAYRSRPLPRG